MGTRPWRRLAAALPFSQSLRTRLVIAFLAVSALSALITAVLTFREAREAILQRTQTTAVHDLRTQIDSLAPALPFPPRPQDLQNFALQLDRAGGSRNWRTSAAYGNGPAVPERLPGNASVVTDALRSAVRDRNEPFYQRVERNGGPWLTIGMPVTFTGTGHKASGLDVYAEFSLADERGDIDSLVTAAQAGAVPALALAVVPALFAARRVLRPVRQLRQAAEKITGGALDTRLKVTGTDELADLTRTFNAMAAALEKDDARLRRLEANSRRFAADVSHELRTPLAAMSAVTEILDEDAGQLPSDTADAVRLISGETRKLTRLTEDLMEVSRFDAGAAALHLDEVDVGDALRRTLRARGWQDRVTADLPEGVRARFDPRRIDVVVANLVGNALRHGGPPVRLAARAEGGRLLIDVSDHGPGIDPEVLPHVFDRFYKADAARVRSEGSGLGLAIAMENVRLHGGTLRAVNKPEGGAVFTVDLPLREEP
ncbi:ATP-binding protein [Streptomyces sp. NPDC001262]|uniref:ATP-binding protein n=1 Tax=Streptomyces sp. NPDC001262 TaxID=3364552 RepID=UPI0036C654C2